MLYPLSYGRLARRPAARRRASLPEREAHPSAARAVTISATRSAARARALVSKRRDRRPSYCRAGSGDGRGSTVSTATALTVAGLVLTVAALVVGWHIGLRQVR